jgi:hypothetical protein
MAKAVEGALLEATERAKRIDFGSEEMTRLRLHIPARLTGGGIKSISELRHPTFVGAILDILPRCIDTRDEKGETTKGIYTKQLRDIIGEGAFDAT